MPESVSARPERWCLAALFSLLTAGAALGQTPAAEQTADQSKDKTIVLSPFVVDASKDQGYRATNTLAGTRINTPLRDIASSITVVTKDFLNDVGARDINDVLGYLANAESSRTFTSYAVSYDPSAVDPQNSNRIRGLNAATIARDYFATIGGRVGFDTYNVDDVTVARGPNSTLFGLGTPAGIVNYGTSQAMMNRDSNKVSIAYGSFEDQRATVDFNRVLLDDKLAIRLMGLWSDRGFEQQPAWYKDKRYYAAGTYKPFRKTTLRASYERAWVDFNNPNSVTPTDNVSGWLAQGRPTWDASSQALSDAAAYNFQNTFKSTPLIVTSLANGGQPEYSFQSRVGNPALPLNGATGFVEYNAPRATGSDPYTLRDDRYFNMHDLNMRPNPGELEYTARNISLDQEIVPDLFVGLAYFSERFHSLDLNFLRDFEYNVDVNSKLPDGRPNPHFLENYTMQWTQENTHILDSTNKSLRATLAYKADLTKWNKWLGVHHFSAFVESREDTSASQSYGDNRINFPRYLDGYSDINNVTLTDRLNYTGGRITPTGEVVKTTQGVAIPVTAALGIPNTYWDVATNSWQYDTMNTGHLTGEPARTYHKVESQAAVWQPHFLEDRIVGTLGWRKDKDITGTTKDTGLQTPFSAETLSWGLVVHPLPWLSLHYSNSENFIPAGAKVTNKGATVGPPTGKGKDYGFSLDLLDGKLNIKLNKFETLALNAVDSELQGRTIFELVQLDGGPLPGGDPTGPNGEIASAVANYNTYQLANNTGVAPISYTPGTPIHFHDYWDKIVATSDQLSKGYELEVTYNPTPNWRIMANVSQQEAMKSNVGGAVADFIAEREPIWRALPVWDTDNSAYWSTSWGRGKDIKGIFDSDVAPLKALLGASEGKPSQQLREWHANLLTNYTFSRGLLKGVGVGGAGQYASRGIIGNPLGYDSTGTPNFIDLDHPYYGSPMFNLDLWASYQRRIWNDKVKWTLQLNVRNVQSSGDYEALHANPDGTHTGYRIVPPRTYYLTSTFEF